MKITFFSLLLCIVPLSGILSQDKSSTTATPVPVDPITKMITYEGVVEVKGVTAKTLYERSLDWFNTNYKNPTDVIRENDAEGNRIMGKHRFKVSNPPDKSGVKGDAGHVQYTLTIAARDGRFKYEIIEFVWKQASVYPCEKWLDKEAPGYQAVYNEYLIQIDKEMTALIANLKDYISHEKPVKDKDNW